MNDSPKQYFVSSAAIFDDNNHILLTKRHAPDNPVVHNHWQFPGGGIEHSEHPKDTLIREIREEISINVDVLLDQPFVYSHLFHETNTHIVLIVYLTRYKSGIIDISRDKEETNDAKWFTIDEIDSLQTLPSITQIAKDTYKALLSLTME